MFAIIFFRLWFLQVLSGDKYLAQANNNRVRDIAIQAPRGDIVDRNGTVLVDNRLSIAVQIEPDKLPPRGAGARRRCYRRLRQVIGMRPRADPQGRSRPSARLLPVRERDASRPTSSQRATPTSSSARTSSRA